MRRAILLFVKYPEPGRVKTRLAATIGPTPAARAYRRLVAHVCRELPDAAEILVFFDPPAAQQRIEEWLRPLLPRSFSLIPQAAGDLGERLQAAFAITFERGAGRALVIGTDCVEMTPATFSEAFAALDHADCAIGPTMDGGYYLLGLRAPAPILFRDIAWSTGRTFADTLAQASAGGLSLKILERLHDVDDEADWHRAAALLTDDRERPLYDSPE